MRKYMRTNTHAHTDTQTKNVCPFPCVFAHVFDTVMYSQTMSERTLKMGCILFFGAHSKTMWCDFHSFCPWKAFRNHVHPIFSPALPLETILDHHLFLSIIHSPQPSPIPSLTILKHHEQSLTMVIICAMAYSLVKVILSFEHQESLSGGEILEQVGKVFGAAAALRANTFGVRCSRVVSRCQR